MTAPLTAAESAPDPSPAPPTPPEPEGDQGLDLLHDVVRFCWLVGLTTVALLALFSWRVDRVLQDPIGALGLPEDPFAPTWTPSTPTRWEGTTARGMTLLVDTTRANPPPSPSHLIVTSTTFIVRDVPSAIELEFDAEDRSFSGSGAAPNGLRAELFGAPWSNSWEFEATLPRPARYSPGGPGGWARFRDAVLVGAWGAASDQAHWTVTTLGWLFLLALLRGLFGPGLGGWARRGLNLLLAFALCRALILAVFVLGAPISLLPWTPVAYVVAWFVAPSGEELPARRGVGLASQRHGRGSG